MAVYAFVSTSYPRHPGDPGGHFVRAEAQRRAAEGHEVHVVCPGADRADGSVRVWGCGGGDAFGWPGALARLRERPTRLTLAAACFLRAARRLRSLPRIDVVVAHFLLPSALLSPARGALEVVGHGSDVRLLTALPAPLRRGIVAALLRRHATFRFASSAGRRVLCEALPQELAHRLLAASRVELPPIEIPPIDPERRRRRRAELCASDETLVAICGRLVASKRFGLALEAAGSIGAVALVIGDGPDRAALERRSRELGLRARFVGRRPRPEALLDLSCADLLVHPSAHEGAPTVIREARALGVPVVCCPSGDVAAWADDDDDLVVVSEALLAEALGALVKSRGRTISRCASVR